MPLYTFGPFTVTNVARTEIVAHLDGSDVTVEESAAVANYPTTDYDVWGPVIDSTPALRRLAGLPFVFKGPFRKNQVVGYVQAVSGSSSFIQSEQ